MSRLSCTLIAVLIAIGAIVIALQRHGSPQSAVPTRTPLMNGKVALGVYDPSNEFKHSRDMEIEQIYHPWRLDNPTEILQGVKAVKGKGRMVLLTIEPWPFNWQGMNEQTLFRDIPAGRYDSSIRAICAALAKEPSTILIRWAHEMELVGQFPWGQGNPQGFVASYQHFVRTCKDTGAKNLKFVWSPAGYHTLVDYWPGGEFVDYIGFTVLGFRGWNTLEEKGAAPQESQSFEEIFQVRYDLVQDKAKPILICEFGVQSDPEIQKRWIDDAFRKLNKYPLLVGVVYFNSRNPSFWNGLKPDWRVSPEFFPPRGGDN